jgi:hypothetical protein
MCTCSHLTLSFSIEFSSHSVLQRWVRFTQHYHHGRPSPCSPSPLLPVSWLNVRGLDHTVASSCRFSLQAGGQAGPGESHSDKGSGLLPRHWKNRPQSKLDSLTLPCWMCGLGLQKWATCAHSALQALGQRSPVSAVHCCPGISCFSLCMQQFPFQNSLGSACGSSQHHFGGDTCSKLFLFSCLYQKHPDLPEVFLLFSFFVITCLFVVLGLELRTSCC